MRAKELRKGVLIGVLLLVAFWLVSSLWGLGIKARVAMSESQEVRQQYRTLEERKTALQANLAALATDRGKDAAIRTAFGVAKPGEEVIVVVPPEAPTTTPPLSWWQALLSWF